MAGVSGKFSREKQRKRVFSHFDKKESLPTDITTSEVTCPHCGFKARYSFIRCPECEKVRG